jgi:hypothetical protein
MSGDGTQEIALVGDNVMFCLVLLPDRIFASDRLSLVFFFGLLVLVFPLPNVEVLTFVS